MNTGKIQEGSTFTYKAGENIEFIKGKFKEVSYLTTKAAKITGISEVAKVSVKDANTAQAPSQLYKLLKVTKEVSSNKTAKWFAEKGNYFTCGLLGRLESVKNILQGSKEIYIAVANTQEVDQIVAAKADEKLLKEFDALSKNSEQFLQAANRTEFPVKNNRIENIVARETAPEKQQALKLEIAQQAREAQPIIHDKTWELFGEFLADRKKNGTPQEKKVYKNMTEADFAKRLYEKRPLAFQTGQDVATLRNGVQLGDGRRAFAAVGTNEEGQEKYEADPERGLPAGNGDSSLTLENYLSPAERELSSLIGLGGPTFFINDGNRTNAGKLPGPNQQAGIEKGHFTGLVGVRFENDEKLNTEYRHMIVKEGVDRNTSLDQVFAKNYDLPDGRFPTYEEAEKDTSGRFLKLENKKTREVVYLDRLAAKKTLTRRLEPHVQATNQRGKKEGVSEELRAVGLGSGVWCVVNGNNIAVEIENLQMEIIDEILSDPKNSSNIATVDFMYFGFALEARKKRLQEDGQRLDVRKLALEEKKAGLDARGGGASQEISSYEEALRYYTNDLEAWNSNMKDFTSNQKRFEAAKENLSGPTKYEFTHNNPATVLPPEKQSHGVSSAYAWDGNSLPGNEYWQGFISASGDPAAASCSTIQQLHNPLINPYIARNVEAAWRSYQERTQNKA